MYKNIVLKYIHMLTPKHIKDYADANNIYATDDEINIIYKFIMKNYDGLLNDNETILKLRPLIRSDLYNSIYEIYLNNKSKYII